METITTLEKANTSLEAKSLEQDFFNNWILSIDAKPKTVETYTRNIRPFIQYLLDNNIQGPTEDTIRAYRDHIAAEHKATTVQAYLIAVKVFFHYLEKQGLYNDIAKDVKNVQIEKGHKKDYLTPEQAKNLISQVDRSTLKGKRDYAILLLMLTSGLRTIEVVRANTEDLKPRGSYYVLYLQGKGRDDKSDFVKVAPATLEAINTYLKARGTNKEGEPLFSSSARRNPGERLTTKSISRLCKEYLLEAGLNSDRLTAHSLRHTAGTLNLIAGGTLQETKDLLRHKDLNTTLIYSHNLDRDKNQSEQRIEDFIFSN